MRIVRIPLQYRLPHEDAAQKPTQARSGKRTAPDRLYRLEPKAIYYSYSYRIATKSQRKGY